MDLHWVSEVNGRSGGLVKGAVKFLNPQILEVGGTKKKKPPSYSFREEEALLWATEEAQDKHTFAAVYFVVTGKSSYAARLLQRVYEWKTSQTAKLWTFSHGSSTHLDQNLLFGSTGLNVTLFSPRYICRNRRVAREKSGWVACFDPLQRGTFSSEIACCGVMLYNPK